MASCTERRGDRVAAGARGSPSLGRARRPKHRAAPQAARPKGVAAKLAEYYRQHEGAVLLSGAGVAALGAAGGFGSALTSSAAEVRLLREQLSKERELRETQLSKERELHETQLSKERELRETEVSKERELREMEVSKERELREKDAALAAAYNARGGWWTR